MISLNFDVFFRTFGDFVAEFKINNFNLLSGKTRASSISAKYTAKLQAWHACNFTGLQKSTHFDLETVTKGSVADS